MPYSDTVENKICDLLHRGQAYTAPATLHVALLKCTHGAIARSTTYAVGNTVAVLCTDTKYHLYRCTAIGTGTTAGSAPTYTGASAEVVVDGGATFTEQSAALCAGTAEVEPSGGAYARSSVTASLANFSGTQGAGTTVASSGTGGLISNNVAIPFPTPSANWTTAPEMIWGWAIYDHATNTAGTNLIEWGPLNTLQSITNGQSAPSFAIGQLQSQIG